MKKTYETPSVEVVKFQYSDQVVARSGCTEFSGHTGDETCRDWSPTGRTN
ncbi:MAG: hypothetical protein Q4B32_11310 [Clostridia bacterium]|nr:hypothetical protein [Clostridia bacterium]